MQNCSLKTGHMTLKLIPDDINLEVLFSYLPEGACKVSMRGTHKRNSYNDIIDIEQKADGNIAVTAGRKSLYNALPEYMFHPVDRYDNLPKLEEKERFQEAYEKQEKEKEDAFSFFNPIDLLLFLTHVDVREALREYTETDKVLICILADRLSDRQKANRFIRQALALLPSCKCIRGNRTFITFMLRKMLMQEGVTIDIKERKSTLEDSGPRYDYRVGATLNSCYAGNVFEENILSYNVHYWPEEACDGNFLSFVDDIEVFRLFVQDYFLGVGETLVFDISHDGAPLRLSDDILYNYLNYNTNI